MSSFARRNSGTWILALVAVVALTPAVAAAKREGSAATETMAPSFTPIPELTAGFELLYTQKFPEARMKFNDWESQHAQEPFGEVAVAASYLFEEFYRQGVLTSDFFLNLEHGK